MARPRPPTDTAVLQTFSSMSSLLETLICTLMSWIPLPHVILSLSRYVKYIRRVYASL